MQSLFELLNVNWNKLSTVVLKNAEFTQTPPSAKSLFLQHVQSAWTHHSVYLQKCGICSSTPFLYLKMRSSNKLPTVSIKNVEVVSTAKSVFTKCRVCLNSPLCFQKMRSSFQLPTLFLQNVQSAWTPHCLFKKCGVYTNSSLWFPKIRNSLELSTVFQKMRSWHELPSAEST